MEESDMMECGLTIPEWPALIEKIRSEQNGVMRVDLYFGHDGDNVCQFSDYDKVLATGNSGLFMQQAVERCYAEWRLGKEVDFATKHGDLYEQCALCGSENWKHQHPELYGVCKERAA